jgi:elongation factor Ts
VVLVLQVRRFVKFNLGEGLEKKSNDFAAEVAQQTQKKEAAPAKPAAKEQPKQPVSTRHCLQQPSLTA